MHGQKKHQHNALICYTSGTEKYDWFYGKNQDRTYIIFSVYEYSIEIYEIEIKYYNIPFSCMLSNNEK
jgi:hypothetical protein